MTLSLLKSRAVSSANQCPNSRLWVLYCYALERWAVNVAPNAGLNARRLYDVSRCHEFEFAVTLSVLFCFLLEVTLGDFKLVT